MLDLTVAVGVIPESPNEVDEDDVVDDGVEHRSVDACIREIANGCYIKCRQIVNMNAEKEHLAAKDRRHGTETQKPCMFGRTCDEEPGVHKEDEDAGQNVYTMCSRGL